MLELMIAATLAASPMTCTMKSPAHTLALVELYTSQGCSSCPPADRWLSQLSMPAVPARIVPIALHVGYWDYIGWKDPFAQRAFNERQSWLAQLARSRSVYTPEVFIGSNEMRDWRSGQTFDSAVRTINAMPARASIELGATVAQGLVETRITAHADSQFGDAQLYVALTSSGMQTAVKAGENRGESLRNDYVVREWSGPLALSPSTLKWTLPAGVAARNAQVIAFVQRSSNGVVLQAVSLPLGACAPS